LIGDFGRAGNVKRTQRTDRCKLLQEVHHLREALPLECSVGRGDRLRGGLLMDESGLPEDKKVRGFRLPMFPLTSNEDLSMVLVIVW
jgi:hypothetical protein